MFYGEDGPQYAGNIGDPSKERELNARKEQYMQHFMIDYLELSLRKIAQENAIHCAKKAGYFQNMRADMDLKSLDSKFEKCLGKYSDSYETGLDVWA